jgi:hypothetical protein
VSASDLRVTADGLLMPVAPRHSHTEMVMLDALADILPEMDQDLRRKYPDVFKRVDKIKNGKV